MINNFKAENIGDFVWNKYNEYAQSHGGVIPVVFNPYNRAEITDKAPTQTAAGNTNCCTSATVLIFQRIDNE